VAALGLTALAGDVLADSRTGKNGWHGLVGLLCQSVYGRLAGYDDVNDADRLGRDPAMRWIVGGKAIERGGPSDWWTRLSCRKFAHNAVRLQLHALAYNLGNFLRTLALPDAVKQWSLTSLHEKLVKIDAKIVRHGRYVSFQMAEVAISHDLFADILQADGRIGVSGIRPKGQFQRPGPMIGLSLQEIRSMMPDNRQKTCRDIHLEGRTAADEECES